MKNIIRFFTTVKERIYKACRPIPEHLQLYYDYWKSRKFTDPKVVRILTKLSDLLGTAITEQILDYVQSSYEDKNPKEIAEYVVSSLKKIVK